MSGPTKPAPIWLDTNVVAAAANGNQVTESFLQKLHDDGHDLLLVPAANNELLYGNPLTMNGEKSVISQVPSEQARTVIELVKVRLGITVDMSAGALESSTRVGYAMQDHVKRPKNQAVPVSLNNISESDSLVLSQIMASAQVRNVDNPIMVTRETGGKGMISQSHLYKVTVMRVPPPGGGGSNGTPGPNSGGGGSSGTPGPSSSSSGVEPGVAPAAKVRSPSTKLTAISLAIGRTIVSVGAMLLMQYLTQILMQKIAKSLIDQRMKEFEPEIQRFATAYGRMIIDNLASGTMAYVTCRVRIEYPIQYAQAGGSFSVDVVATLPLTNLDAIWITERDHTGESKHTLGGSFGNQTDVHEYTFSVSVGSQITKDQVATYRAINAQINLYQTALRNAVNAMANRADINREIQELMDALDETFGGGFQFTPDQKLWTEEGYEAMVGGTGGAVYSGLPELRM